MDLFCSDSLHPFSEDIINTVDVDEIVPVMLQKGLVTLDHYQDLSSKYCPMGEKQRRLIGIILRLPEDCVDMFLYCLQKTSNYEPHKQLYQKLYTHYHTTTV